jgi:23S rRNA (adenine2030-N6)-methyltransferase
MNYRHAFHAGNFADVLKHAVLALVLDHLKLKDTAFGVVDTHAGCGHYDLASDEAHRTGEWLGGIGRLWDNGESSLPSAPAAALRPYLDVVAGLNPDGVLSVYPGSPALALALMRPGDRLVANELHPEDAAVLRQEIGQDARAKVMEIDGWQALRAVLPPKERRGVVLIDPPFEEAGEFERLDRGVAQAMRRFATGTYLVWFPIKDRFAVESFAKALSTRGYRRTLLAELDIGADAEKPGKLRGSGLAVINAPYRLDEHLEVLLPFLAERLKQGEGGGHRLTWLSETA